MKKLIALSLTALATLLTACVAPAPQDPIDSDSEEVASVAQADVVVRNDPTAIVEEINTNGAVYSARHLLLPDQTAEWIALDNGVFTITTNDTDLKLQPGVYNMFVGAEVIHGGECDLCLHSAYDTYHAVISTGTYVSFTDP